MAIYNPDTPVLFLQGEIGSISIVSRYEHDDDTGLGPSGLNVPISFRTTVRFKSVVTGSAATREAYTYSVLDIKTGDWIADSTGNICLKITSIISIDTNEGEITFVVEDIDAYVHKTYRTNVLSAGDRICAFEVSDSGEAIIAGNSNYFFKANVGSIDKIQARFQVKEKSESYRLKFDTPQTTIEVGDVVTISSNGDLIPINSPGANAYKLGYVVSKTYNDTIVYIKPFNAIVDDFAAPERLTGSIGDVYYASSSAYGELTTNPSLGNNEMFLHFKDAIPTVIQADAINLGMVEGDSLVINDVNIFSPLGTGVTKTSAEIRNEINLHTSDHHVSAYTYVPNAENYSGKVTQPVNGDAMIVVAPVGTPTTVLASIRISDGTNFVDYQPSTIDTTYNNQSGTTYQTISANQVAQDLNTLFSASHVDIVASTFIWDQANFKSQYPGLKLTSGAGKEVTISKDNLFSDYTGATFTEALGLEISVSMVNVSYLQLTRVDGGDILLQGEGTFVNSNGMVSSSSGTPALLLMIEDELIGAQGPIGPQGDKGQKGDQGIKGDVGPQGPQGDKGDKGQKGDQGIKGDVGPQGSKGDKGQKGEIGAQGPQGAQGLQGIDGPQGAQGLQGVDGPQGAQGQKGEVGAQDLQGIDGPQGAQGLQGEVGAQGLQGIDGPQGAQGLQGVDGPQGAQGDKGQKGEVGAQGLQGVDGPQGAQGQKGEVGAQGLQGVDGPQGAQGLQGVDGPQGAQGNQGAVGPQGAQGNVGPQGAQGLQGLQGDKGQKGDIGAQGATGAQGAEGYEGSTFKLNYDTALGQPTDPGTPDFRLNTTWTSTSTSWVTIDDFDGENKFTATLLQNLGTPYHITFVKVGAPNVFKIVKVTGFTDNTGYTYLEVSHVAASGSPSNGDEMIVNFSKDGEKGAQGLQGIDGPQGAQGID
jgi:hypothetical protein